MERQSEKATKEKWRSKQATRQPLLNTIPWVPGPRKADRCYRPREHGQLSLGVAATRDSCRSKLKALRRPAGPPKPSAPLPLECLPTPREASVRQDTGWCSNALRTTAPSLALESRHRHSNPCAGSVQRCDPGHVTKSLCAFVFSSVKWGCNSTRSLGSCGDSGS